MNIFNTLNLLCSFELSLMTDSEELKMSFLIILIHNSSAKYCYLNMMYFYSSMKGFGAEEGVILTKTLRIP